MTGGGATRRGGGEGGASRGWGKLTEGVTGGGRGYHRRAGRSGESPVSVYCKSA